MIYIDPAKLNASQRRILDAVVKYGRPKICAKYLRISPSTVESNLTKIRQLNDLPDYTSIVLMGIAWDRQMRYNAMHDALKDFPEAQKILESLNAS